ncbi:helix-turn-helix domain-containing protein [Bradyrhizobium septentrionale]|uniref:Helix-turn-helix domain-containing protein n=1 Tax=Bradyrhizobium septentrionale TaxID=1404411 RepID=A0A974A3Y1_9BRAD|nr:IclR family transcriptional regulator C-terminal domain-containing protein [Bradyrhizobium septentrionale]UGY15499.1 helix-turn-helix domain-containing protein [Bradyrhizobium septentrionale]UGY24081.1 helix-turn-helix domain-containing protein [Bradyrhizobium septentrionale]
MPRGEAKAVSVSRPAQADERPAHFVQSLERGFQILRAFDREHPSMTVSEVAGRTGLTRGTAQRFLLTLVDLGYAEHDGKRFGLRPKVLDLGFAYLASNDVWDTVEPFVEEVVNELNESCTVGVLDWPDIVYVCRVQAHRVVNAALSVGSRVPANASSLGRVLLAYLDPQVLDRYLLDTPLPARTRHTITNPRELRKALNEVRKNGWALGDQEYEEGVRSVSVPLRNRQGSVIAAIKVVAPTSRATKEEMIRRFLPVLRQAAERANEALRAR